MNRLLVALLAALDAVLAAAGGLAIALAPLTLLWVFGFGGEAAWEVLWPVSALVWQLGHLIPVAVSLPADYLVLSGIDPAAGAFVLSLAPLGFAVFTAGFAARSGRRAALGGEPVTGLVTGVAVFAALSSGVLLTSSTPVAAVEPWQAIVFPVLVYALPCAAGAAVGAWMSRVPPLARVRAAADRLHGAWPAVPALAARGAAMTLAGLVGIAALVLAAALVARGGQVVALFQAGNVDLVGVIVFALGQLLYLPTLVGWALSFAAGPGFAVGTGTAVSPAGTQLGVVPGIPVLGVIPESTSPWMLLLALLPVALGAVIGWMLRSRLSAETGPTRADLGARAVLLGVVALSGAAIAALWAVLASGSIGPGRLAEVGPAPGPLALAVGVELALGAGILLLSPRRTDDDLRDDDRLATATPKPGMTGRPSFEAQWLRAPAWTDLVPEPEEHAPTGASAESSGVDPGAKPPGGERPRAGSAASRAGTADAPGPAPEAGADRPSAGTQPGAEAGSTADSEQETEPIIGFERGSGRTPPRES